MFGSNGIVCQPSGFFENTAATLDYWPEVFNIGWGNDSNLNV